jgi:hypothetical protein
MHPENGTSTKRSVHERASSTSSGGKDRLPAHVALADPRIKAGREHKIKSLKTEIAIATNKIADIGDDIKKKTTALKHQRSAITKTRIARGRIIADTNAVKVDRALRPSDREHGIRVYSKMDADVWRFDDLRKWFNNYANEDELKSEEAAVPLYHPGYTVLRG